jgi:hypothetical protein
MARIATRPRSRRADELQFTLLLVATYPLFLAAAVVDRLLPPDRRFLAAPGEKPGVFTAALAAAKTTLPYAFMG